MPPIDRPPCRCGAPADADPHPCHGKDHTCKKPATQRFYGLYLPALAGAQMKLGASETWSCDECWAFYLRQVELHKQAQQAQQEERAVSQEELDSEPVPILRGGRRRPTILEILARDRSKK